MIKSELIDWISAQNPHLYRQDAEKIVDAIFYEITAAMAVIIGLSYEGLAFSLRNYETGVRREIPEQEL